jgi:hypothetical protein
MLAKDQQRPIAQLAPSTFLAEYALESPFNVGHHFRLQNFYLDEISRLFANLGIGVSKADLAIISYITGGQHISCAKHCLSNFSPDYPCTKSSILRHL